MNDRVLSMAERVIVIINIRGKNPRNFNQKGNFKRVIHSKNCIILQLREDKLDSFKLNTGNSKKNLINSNHNFVLCTEHHIGLF